MLMNALLVVSGAVACYLFVACRQRQEGDTLEAMLLRPLSGGGPRPGTPR